MEMRGYRGDEGEWIGGYRDRFGGRDKGAEGGVAVSPQRMSRAKRTRAAVH